MKRPSTLGELKQTGYQVRTVKDEMRNNLIQKLKQKETLFPALLATKDRYPRHRQCHPCET